MQVAFSPRRDCRWVVRFLRLDLPQAGLPGGSKEGLVNRIFGQYFSAEVAVLCLIEWALTSVIIYAHLMSATGSNVPLVHASAGNLSALLGLTIGATAVMIGLYRPEICYERGRLLVSASVAGVLAFPGLLLVSETLAIDLSRGYLLWLAQGLVAWVICLLFTRWVFSLAMRHRIFVRRIVVLGVGREAARTRELIQSHRGKIFEIVNSGTFAWPPTEANRAATDWLDGARAKRIWGIVVVSDPGHDDMRVDECPSGPLPPALLDLKLRGVRVFDELSFWEQHLGRINLDRVDARWLTFADGFSSGWLGDGVKRVTDILISLAVLILTLPLMLITALLIKLDTPGPVFYRQERVGLHGRIFTLCKFRSMAVDAEVGGQPRWASQKDKRVTRVGAFIRSTRIDELPQLLNVLKGEMSFVGPRPERPHFVEQLSQIIPFYHERSYVKAGITGWAQVNFPYGASVEDARQKLSYDLYYVKNRSLFLDIMILFSTVRVILFREGAR